MTILLIWSLCWTFSIAIIIWREELWDSMTGAQAVFSFTIAPLLLAFICCVFAGMIAFWGLGNFFAKTIWKRNDSKGGQS